MSKPFRVPSVGIEEEYQLIHRESGALVPASREVLNEVQQRTRADIQHELHLEQIEMASPVLESMGDVRRCLVETRRRLNHAAARHDAKLCAAGTHAMNRNFGGHVTPKPRYLIMAERFQAIAKQLMIFGCHVHIDMADRELGVQVMNRLRRWIPLLQAITANSPFWAGRDTGYASFRREQWSQWPLAGIPTVLQDSDELDACIEELVQAEIIDDATKIYWDVRLPIRVPTIEIRVADMITNIDDVVGYVAICRALIMQCETEFYRGITYDPTRPELLRGAMWQAARYGLSESLVDPKTKRQAKSKEMLEDLFRYLTPSLEYAGDAECVRQYIDRLLRNGSPSETQRQYAKEFDGDLSRLALQLADDTIRF